MCGLLQIITNRCPKEDSPDCASLPAIVTSACGESGGTTGGTNGGTNGGTTGGTTTQSTCCWKQDCPGGTLCKSTNTCPRACEISCSETNIQIPTGAQLDIIGGAFYYGGQLVECV